MVQVNPDPDDLMCATCHRPLDTITDAKTGEIVDSWHASALSVGPRHDPIPVPRVEEQAVLICDFCSAPEADWRYPAKTFDSPDLLVDQASKRALRKGFDLLTPRSVEDWCACHDCHDDIERGRWEQIVNRATRGTPKEIRRELKDHIRRLHRQFLANRTGPAIREQQHD